jgi:hypothetical protein
MLFDSVKNRWCMFVKVVTIIVWISFEFAYANPLIMMLGSNRANMSSNPANWIDIWSTDGDWTAAAAPFATGLIGKAYRCTAAPGTSTEYRKWYPGGSAFGDGEILIRVQSPFPGGTSGGLKILTRMSGADVAAANGYFFSIVSALGIPKLRIVKVTVGAGTNLATSAAITYNANTWYWARARAQGSNLSFKIWAHGTAEPGAWDITAVDATYTTGFIGFGCGWSVLSIDYFTFVSGTGTAPGPG